MWTLLKLKLDKLCHSKMHRTLPQHSEARKVNMSSFCSKQARAPTSSVFVAADINVKNATVVLWNIQKQPAKFTVSMCILT